jgi:hypothetical protein
MRSEALIIAGSIILAFGVLFIAQSRSIVGPESSFMYRNSDWAVNGSAISITGAVMIVTGIVFSVRLRHIHGA